MPSSTPSIKALHYKYQELHPGEQVMALRYLAEISSRNTSGNRSLASQDNTFSTTQPDDATVTPRSKANSTQQPFNTQYAGSKASLSEQAKTEDTTTQG